jgi:hypothetical protein
MTYMTYCSRGERYAYEIESLSLVAAEHSNVISTTPIHFKVYFLKQNPYFLLYPTLNPVTNVT